MPPADTGVMPLTWHDLLISSILVIIFGTVSLLMRLRLEKPLGIAAVRTVVQLMMIGYVLKWVFHLNNPLLIVSLMVIMVAIAAFAAIGRSSRKYPGVLARSFATLLISGLFTTFIVTEVVIRIHPWYRPQYVIPLLGMILGNALTGVSLSLDHLLESLQERRAEVEMELALGATRWEAASSPMRDAIRRGMIPILNSMAVVGLVSLPGMMTGQILSGTDPLVAVKYQIVVMFMIAAATATSCILITLLTYHRLFNHRHQLVIRLLSRQKT